jgi:hypothetical protein
MFYIHQSSSIWAQENFTSADFKEPVDRKIFALEPAYQDIPPGILRRMGKAVRMGVGAAMPLLQNNIKPNGIIIGTTNSGKEDCVKFLNQIVDYNEGMLTPINFVQSTPNATAAQIGLLTNNHGYNITHTQLGLAFEFAAIDADMFLQENPMHNYLLGAVDDISTFNYNFEDKDGAYKKEDISTKNLYESNTPGCIAGEAASMFLVNNISTGAIAKLVAIDTLHNEDEQILKEKLQYFIENNLPKGEKIDLLLSGENGDSRLNKYYETCEAALNEESPIAHYKHLSGEYPTAIAMGLVLACSILQKQQLPTTIIKRKGNNVAYKNILIYNNYKAIQHSFMLVSIPK